MKNGAKGSLWGKEKEGQGRGENGALSAAAWSSGREEAWGAPRSRPVPG